MGTRGSRNASPSWPSSCCSGRWSPTDAFGPYSRNGSLSSPDSTGCLRCCLSQWWWRTPSLLRCAPLRRWTKSTAEQPCICGADRRTAFSASRSPFGFIINPAAKWPPPDSRSSGCRREPAAASGEQRAALPAAVAFRCGSSRDWPFYGGKERGVPPRAPRAIAGFGNGASFAGWWQPPPS
jgi:hypothetical protein